MKAQLSARRVSSSSTVLGLTIGLLALALAAPFLLYPVFLMRALCMALFACAFNLLLGYTGLLSFGHAAYLGLPAYATGWLVRTAGCSPSVGVRAGADRNRRGRGSKRG